MSNPCSPNYQAVTYFFFYYIFRENACAEIGTWLANFKSETLKVGEDSSPISKFNDDRTVEV